MLHHIGASMSNLKYGILIGKYSKCWHNGHQSLVDKIREDGLTPIILMGSAQYENTPSCPYGTKVRREMITLVNPGIQIYEVDDCDDWEEWVLKIHMTITVYAKVDPDEVTIYTHNKPEDLMDFTYKGVDYKNEYYSKVFEVEGINITPLPLSTIDIRGTRVHEDLEGNKEFLDEKVYNYLKDLHAKD